MQQLVKFIHNIRILIISDPTREFSQLAYLCNQIALNLIELRSDRVKRIEIPFDLISLDPVHFFPQALKILNDRRHALQNALLPMLAILDVTQCLLLKEPTDE